VATTPEGRSPWGTDGRRQSAEEAFEQVRATLEGCADGSFAEVFPGALGSAVVQMLLAHCCGEVLESYVSPRTSCRDWLHWIESTKANVDTPRPRGSASHISHTSGHGCAITSLGAAACWGNNFGGEVGDGTAGNQRFEPVWWNPEACSMARH
jgi:hypothetical protein